MKDKKRIVILGAGLAGLSCAWHLQRRGIDCQLFEKAPQVGGLCRSQEIAGFTFDCDGHLLHFKSADGIKLVRHFLKGNLQGHRRNSWVYSHRQYLRYPFQANFFGLPAKIVEECLLGFIRASANGKFNKKKLNFRDWIKFTFGKGIARHFMLPYNRKFWTIPLEKLTCEWLDGLVPVPQLEKVIEGAFRESQHLIGYNSNFWYPKTGGIMQLPLAMAREVRDIHTSSAAVRIDLKKRQVQLSSGKAHCYDYLVSTLSLPALAEIVKDLPRDVAEALRLLKWVSVFNLNLGIRQRREKLRHWVYFPGREFAIFRAGFYHNFSCRAAPANKGALYCEVSYSKAKPIEKDKIVRQIKRDLQRAGIIRGNRDICIEDINDIDYGYPLYDKNYNRARSFILRYLGKNGLFACGRYGSWQYLSMEGSILDGRQAADMIAGI